MGRRRTRGSIRPGPARTDVQVAEALRADAETALALASLA